MSFISFVFTIRHVLVVIAQQSDEKVIRFESCPCRAIEKTKLIGFVKSLLKDRDLHFTVLDHGRSARPSGLPSRSARPPSLPSRSAWPPSLPSRGRSAPAPNIT